MADAARNIARQDRATHPIGIEIGNGVTVIMRDPMVVYVAVDGDLVAADIVGKPIALQFSLE